MVKTLERKDLLLNRAFIGGEWVSASKTFDVKNPATGELLATLPDGDGAMAEKAIAMAVAPQKLWAKKNRQGTQCGVKKMGCLD